jgi:hypothetical protein
MVRIITEAAPKDWRAAAWFLERRFHSEWRQRRTDEIGNAEGEPIRITMMEFRPPPDVE